MGNASRLVEKRVRIPYYIDRKLRVNTGFAKEKYAPWHPKNVIAHPRRTWRMAFGIITDAEWEGILAHMDDKGTGNGSKKGK